MITRLLLFIMIRIYINNKPNQGTNPNEYLTKTRIKYHIIYNQTRAKTPGNIRPKPGLKNKSILDQTGTETQEHIELNSDCNTRESKRTQGRNATNTGCNQG